MEFGCSQNFQQVTPRFCFNNLLIYCELKNQQLITAAKRIYLKI